MPHQLLCQHTAIRGRRRRPETQPVNLLVRQAALVRAQMFTVPWQQGKHGKQMREGIIDDLRTGTVRLHQRRLRQQSAGRPRRPGRCYQRPGGGVSPAGRCLVVKTHLQFVTDLSVRIAV